MNDPNVHLPMSDKVKITSDIEFPIRMIEPWSRRVVLAVPELESGCDGCVGARAVKTDPNLPRLGVDPGDVCGNLPVCTGKNIGHRPVMFIEEDELVAYTAARLGSPADANDWLDTAQTRYFCPEGYEYDPFDEEIEED